MRRAIGACGGGAGGSGAGGQGGGGAGRLSLGILSNAASHTMVDNPTSFVLGTPGSGGAFGVGGDGGSVSTDHAPA